MVAVAKEVAPGRWRASAGRCFEDFTIGDIYAESAVLAKRESNSRRAQGIVTVRKTGMKDDGTVFMTCARTVLVPKRGHGIED